MARLRSVPRKGRDEAAKKQPAATKKQPAGMKKQPAATKKQPAATKKQPAAMKKQPAAMKKQPAAMKKRAAEPERAVAAAMKRAGKSGEATSDGSLPPTLVGEDDTILLRREKFMSDPSLVYQPWQPQPRVQEVAKMLSSLGNDGEDGKKLRQAFIR